MVQISTRIIEREFTYAFCWIAPLQVIYLTQLEGLCSKVQSTKGVQSTIRKIIRLKVMLLAS